jgi:hypothetical protein
MLKNDISIHYLRRKSPQTLSVSRTINKMVYFLVLPWGKNMENGVKKAWSALFHQHARYAAISNGPFFLSRFLMEN